MTLTIDLSPQTEAWIEEEAQQLGVPAADLARRILDERARPTAQALKDTSESSAEKVRAMLHQWQKETATETSPAISAHELFARWAEEDANMTDEEKEAEDRLWEEFQKGINETRAVAGTRLL